MRNWVIAAGAALALAAPGAVSEVRAQQQLELFATLVGADGAPAAALELNDIRILEGGADLKVLKIDRVTGWPTKVQVLIDNGAGIGSENLIHLRNGLRNLLSALPAGVEVTVVTTAPQPRMLVRPTTDRLTYIKGPDMLAPDTGAAKFVEAMREALQRIERDKENHFPIIISMASAAGDVSFRDSDVEQIQKRVVARPVTIHGAVLTSPGRTASQGAIQGELSMWATKVTGGRFESIAAASRITTLLEEFGVKAAESAKKQSQQFRLTVERPNPSAPVGGIGGAVRAGLTLTGLSFDGRHP